MPGDLALKVIQIHHFLQVLMINVIIGFDQRVNLLTNFFVDLGVFTKIVDSHGKIVSGRVSSSKKKSLEFIHQILF